jgi:sugar phosphate isomerase/epimerase
MRYAMSGHQFRTMLPHPETGIKMAARYGYHGIEPFQDDMPQYLRQPPEAFKKVLDASGLALCTVGSGGQYLDPARIQETIESNAARARYVTTPVSRRFTSRMPNSNTRLATAGKVRRRVKRNITESTSISVSALVGWTSRHSSGFCASAITTGG